MKFYKHLLCTLSICVLLLSSCIRDDLTDCPPELYELQIVFTYDTPSGSRSFDPDELQTAHLYIFDENGNYVRTISYKNPELYRNYPLSIELIPGKYEFIVWFNKTDVFDVLSSNSNEIIGNPFRNEDILHLAVPSEGYITSSIPLILYGEIDKQEIAGDRNQTVMIPLEQNTNTINLTVKGLPQTGNDYYHAIIDHNANETFLNKPAPGRDFSYVAPMRKSESFDLVSSLRILKLYKENQPKLVIWDETEKRDLYPGKSGLSNDLIKLILDKYPDVDFKTTHVFDVILVYDTDMNVTVDVQLWNDHDTDYVIEPD